MWLSNARFNHVVDAIVKLVSDYQLSPQQARYVFKRVREKSKLQLPKVKKSLPDFLSAAEIYRLLEVCKDDVFDGLLVEFLIFTGLRISEATNLQVGHISFSDNIFKVVEGKGHKDRYVPLSTNLQHKIRLYLNGRTSGYVFGKVNGRKYTVRALQKRIKNRLDECGFPKKLSTHSLRHTFACLCLARGIALDRIKLLMGHSSIKTTEIYAKLELGAVKDQFLSLMDMRR